MSVKKDSITTPVAFGEALAAAGDKYENLYAIAADTTKSMGYTKLMAAHPDKVVNCGIAEQHMALMGAGAASCGAKAVIASYACFVSMRALEQLRTFIGYGNLDVKIVAGLAGLAGSLEGVTHEGLEDISIMRGIANMVILVPADAASTIKIAEKMFEYTGPCYLRLGGRTPFDTTFDDSYTFEIGKANVLESSGADAAIIVCGAPTHRAILARELLVQKGYSVQLIEMPCIKPIDREAIVKAAKETGLIVTIEENNILGGLGGAVAEVLGEEYPCRLKRLGIQDCYAESAEHDELLDKYGFKPEDLAREIETAIQNK